MVFNLKAGNDQVFPSVLGTNTGPIVDEQVFPADKVMSDEDIVAAKPFAGQYTIDSYKKNELVSLKSNPDYNGLLGKPANDSAMIKYYADSNNLKLDVQGGNIDVAGRSLTATDAARPWKGLQGQGLQGPRWRAALHRLQLRHHAVRRQDTRSRPRQGPGRPPGHGGHCRPRRPSRTRCTREPTFLPTPWCRTDFLGAIQPMKDLYGDGSGKPSLDKAKKVLSDAGITGPVTVKLQYNPDHYGKSSGDEYAMVKEQLEKSGLFTVDLQSTEWVTYSKDRTADALPRLPARLVPGLLRCGQLPHARSSSRATSSRTTMRTRLSRT